MLILRESADEQGRRWMDMTSAAARHALRAPLPLVDLIKLAAMRGKVA